MKKSFGWVFCGIIVSLMVFAEARAAKGEIGETAPSWSLPGLDGKTVNLSDFKGKVVILDFWATWCPPCREEIPSFIQIQKDLSEKGVVVVGIALDEEGASAVKPFAKKKGINYPLVIGAKSTTEAYGGIEGIPTTFIINRDGKIVGKHIGLTTKEEFLKELGISAYRLSKDTRIPQTRISEIIKGARRVTADTALRLSKYFGTTPKFWLGLQDDFDLDEERIAKESELNNIKHYATTAA